MRHAYLILVLHNAAIATITSLPVGHTLTYGAYYNSERGSEVRDGRDGADDDGS
jgi:hypothetical protein